MIGVSHGLDAAGADARCRGGQTSPARPAPAEPKWDGYRALLARYADGRVMIRSRRGTDTTMAFPEVTAAAAALPVDVGLDGVM
ncbi:hypothetical protein [Streptomyces sp. LN549]|uniref:ATP-dependent DNA ligase n=1 Tax=Streptomyces sp. LN549 TaxID=3112979 RepID=UPI0037218120